MKYKFQKVWTNMWFEPDSSPFQYFGDKTFTPHWFSILFSHLLLIHTRSINSEIINSYYHIRRYTDKVSQTRQCNQASCSSLLSATGQWALGQPRKESQFPAFGNLHKSPSWRQASGQTVEFDEEESMVGWRGAGWKGVERQLEREVGKDHVGEVGWRGDWHQLGSSSA